MSQIASAFAAPSGALADAQRHLAAGDWSAFWGSIRPFTVDADFPFSGYVVVVLTEYLRDRGIELPVSDDAAVRLLVERCDPLVCARGPDAAAAATALARVTASDAELGDYWREFTGDGEPGGGAPMRAALDWLRTVLAADRGADWCLVLEG